MLQVSTAHSIGFFAAPKSTATNRTARVPSSTHTTILTHNTFSRNLSFNFNRKGDQFNQRVRAWDTFIVIALEARGTAMLEVRATVSVGMHTAAVMILTVTKSTAGLTSWAGAIVRADDIRDTFFGGMGLETGHIEQRVFTGRMTGTITAVIPRRTAMLHVRATLGLLVFAAAIGSLSSLAARATTVTRNVTSRADLLWSTGLGVFVEGKRDGRHWLQRRESCQYAHDQHSNSHSHHRSGRKCAKVLL